MLKIAWSGIYIHQLPPKHRFPMEKYALLPQQLLYEGTVEKENFFEPATLTETDILRVHAPDYWQNLKNLTLPKKEERRIGFPLTEKLVQREITINQGTIDCAEFALEYGIAVNLAGGTHHAFTDRGEGFCMLNDIAIAAQYLLAEKKASKILVIDLDVHQGNGTAEIFRYNSQVFTFSMHGEKNYPLHKEISDWDIALPDGTNDVTYLKILQESLPTLWEEVKPDVVFYQAGVDVLASDRLGRLGMTITGCRERDAMVLTMCQKMKTPVVVSMGGGYSPKVADIVEAHANTFRVAQAIFF